MEINYLLVDAFTTRPFAGNPAGVVLDAGGLSDEVLQLIAREIKASETAFVTESQKADYRVRFFSPKKEVPLCGHATVATFYAMAKKGLVSDGQHVTATQETSVGVLPVHIHGDDDGNIKIMMEQNPPEIRQPDIGIEEVADALNIDVGEINPDFPLLGVSTGNTSLKVPINTLASVQNMLPNFRKVLALSNKADVGSLHIFTFDTLAPESTCHNRNFAPHHGIDEDPVTGTASGSLAAYLIHNKLASPGKMLMEQGHEINRPGRVEVEINADMSRILVGGPARIVMEGKIII